MIVQIKNFREKYITYTKIPNIVIEPKPYFLVQKKNIVRSTQTLNVGAQIANGNFVTRDIQVIAEKTSFSGFTLFISGNDFVLHENLEGDLENYIQVFGKLPVHVENFSIMSMLSRTIGAKEATSIEVSNGLCISTFSDEKAANIDFRLSNYDFVKIDRFGNLSGSFIANAPNTPIHDLDSRMFERLDSSAFGYRPVRMQGSLSTVQSSLLMDIERHLSPEKIAMWEAEKTGISLQSLLPTINFSLMAGLQVSSQEKFAKLAPTDYLMFSEQSFLQNIEAALSGGEFNGLMCVEHGGFNSFLRDIQVKITESTAIAQKLIYDAQRSFYQNFSKFVDEGDFKASVNRLMNSYPDLLEIIPTLTESFLTDAQTTLGTPYFSALTKLYFGRLAPTINDVSRIIQNLQDGKSLPQSGIELIASKMLELQNNRGKFPKIFTNPFIGSYSYNLLGPNLMTSLRQKIGDCPGGPITNFTLPDSSARDTWLEVIESRVLTKQEDSVVMRSTIRCNSSQWILPERKSEAKVLEDFRLLFSNLINSWLLNDANMSLAPIAHNVSFTNHPYGVDGTTFSINGYYFKGLGGFSVLRSDVGNAISIDVDYTIPIVRLGEVLTEVAGSAEDISNANSVVSEHVVNMVTELISIYAENLFPTDFGPLSFIAYNSQYGFLSVDSATLCNADFLESVAVLKNIVAKDLASNPGVKYLERLDSALRSLNLPHATVVLQPDSSPDSNQVPPMAVLV